MNAVNLIPADSRKRRLTSSASWPTLALIGALVAVLAGTVLYVSAANQVKSRQTQLAQVTASAQSWKRVASAYQSFTQTAQQRNQQLADIRQLVVGRYPWEQLLSQIGGLMPSTAALTSLQATSSTPAAATPPPSTGSATTGTASAASGTAAATTAATAPAAAPPLPAVQLSGCAASQSSVAQTMVQLRRVQGVSAVSLASASEGGSGSSGGAGGSSGAAGGSGASGGCPFPVQFEMSLTFTQPVSTATTPSTGAGTGTSSTGSATTPATTGAGSTPTASASTQSTGA